MQWLLLFFALQDAPRPLFPVDTTPILPAVIEPAAEATLQLDEVLVVVRESPILLLTSPEGVVSVQYEQGPLKIYAKTRGSSQATWSVYDDPACKHVYLVTPIAAGKVELLAAESLESSSVVRQMLTVVGGGPRPPPSPTPKPEPQPTPVPRPSPGDLRVLLLLDESDKPSASIAVRSQSVTDWLAQNCVKVAGRAEWRLYDRSTVSADGELDDEPEVWRRLYAAVSGKLPDGPVCVVARGTNVRIATFSDTASLLNVLTGEIP